MKFPEDFTKSVHPVFPCAIQYKATKSNGQTISIVGGAIGLYGNGITTFEMWDFDNDSPEPCLTVDDINTYLSTI